MGVCGALGDGAALGATESGLSQWVHGCPEMARHTRSCEERAGYHVVRKGSVQCGVDEGRSHSSRPLSCWLIPNGRGQERIPVQGRAWAWGGQPTPHRVPAPGRTGHRHSCAGRGDSPLPP